MVGVAGRGGGGVAIVGGASLQRQVLGLDGGASRAVDLRRRLRELVEVGEVFDRRPAPPAVEIGDEGGPVDRGVDHVVTADGDGFRRVASLDLEKRRRLGRLLYHPGGVDAYALALAATSSLLD